MEHNFYRSKQIENSNRNRADEFYRSLGATNITIHDYNTDSGKYNQVQDIDVTVQFSRNSGKIDVNISEKARTKNYGDTVLELYSKYPQQKGWGLTGNSDRVAIFYPDEVVVFHSKDLKRVAEELLDPVTEFIQETGFRSGKTTVKIDGQNIKVDVKVTSSSGKYTSRWDSVFVCISYSDLDKLNVKYTRFPNQVL